MGTTRIWLLLVALAPIATACGGDDGGPSGPDVCSGAIYDPCDTEHDCSSARCQGFPDGLLVCSQTCTPNDPSTCPEADGEPAICTENGVCRPPRANDCVRD